MLPELLGSDRSEQRFMREAQAIAGIDHPGVIKVHDYFSEGGAYYMVMEYFQAMSLSDYIAHLSNAKKHEFTPIFTQVLDALEAVHQRGQVHRDLKPSNVLIDAKEQIKLIDFGLVKGGGSLVSVSGKYLGTPGYTAPEQEIDSAMADARSDIYSMGGLMYYCTSGGMHPPRVVFPSSVPELHREQVLTCLHEIQDERYQTASALRDALRGARKGQVEESAPDVIKVPSSQAPIVQTVKSTVVKPPDPVPKAGKPTVVKPPDPVPKAGKPTVIKPPDPAPKAKKPTKAGDEQIFHGIAFVYCPAWTFMMGSYENEYEYENEKPIHEVKISRGFWMGKYPVTQGQWESVMGQNPSRFRESKKGLFGIGGKQTNPNNPVEQVSWEDAQEFIKKLNTREGCDVGSRQSSPGNLPPGCYRLPTEAEWEYAARARTSTTYHWGNEINGIYVWYEGNSSETTHPVGEKRPNSWNLYDMSGNVWEWVIDCYDSNYYKNSPGVDPVNTNGGSARVFRGGGWDSSARYCRSARRGSNSPGRRCDALGFRLLRTASP
jgi:formylglycine-generating enzyme required for sulfatase activity